MTYAHRKDIYDADTHMMEHPEWIYNFADKDIKEHLEPIVEGDEDVLKSINFYSKESLIQEIFPVSSINGDGVSRLLERSNKYLKIKESKYQSKDKVQIKKELFYSEVTREKILDKVHKEIPYQCDVITDKVENRKNEIKIFQTIEVRRKSHKSIVIGKRGSLLKEIGSSSRKEIAKHENKKIHLFLFVKVVSEKKL